jgi:hypothetical protein
MVVFLEVLAGLLTAIALSFALAHAAELPGKMRLDKERYFTVQTIYYPGFTIGGIFEVASIVVVLLLLLVMPYGSPEFWLVAAAFLALCAMQAIFWLMTQPVNRFWLRDTDLSGSAERFFRTGAAAIDPSSDWTVFRDRWERSHVMRSIAAMLGMILLLTAIAR